MPRLLRRLGLRAILYLAFPAGLALILLLLAAVLTRSVHSSLQAGLAARGNATLRNLAARSLLPLLRQRPDLADAVFDDVFEDPEVSFAVILSPNGQPLAQRLRDDVKPHLRDILEHFATSGAGQSFSAFGNLCLQAKVTSEDLLEKADTRSAEEEHLLMNGAETTQRPGHLVAAGTGRGAVYVGLSERTIEAQINDLRRQVLALLLVGTALFTLMVFWIFRGFVLRPLSEMTQSALRVAAYDLTVDTESLSGLSGTDGFGQLATALSVTIHNLSQTLARTRGVTEAVTAVIVKIGKSSDSVAHGAQTTFASVDETSASMAEVLQSLRGIGRSVEVLDRSADESGQDIARMAQLSRQMVHSVQDLSRSVEETAVSIEQMTFSIKDVAGSIEDLSDSAKATSSAMNEMDQATGRVEISADETAHLSEQVQLDAETGVAALRKTLQGIDDIQSASVLASHVFDSLRAKILTIGDTLNVIDGVAEQTNLLAINAAIIAAQAGEHGKGFAVVADEIKDLAERTGLSTKEIAELIRNIQEESRNAIAAMERGVKNVEEGVRLGGEAEGALKKIFESAKKSTQMVKAIARATVEQARGSKQVTNAINRIAETVQQIAKATGEQAHGSEQIMKSAEKMKIITKHVERSSQEQARGSKQITRSIESISEMVNHLNRAQKEQTKGSEQVMHAVENIKSVAEAQNRSMADLETAIDLLRQQAEVLRDEVRRFKV